MVVAVLGIRGFCVAFFVLFFISHTLNLCSTITKHTDKSKNFFLKTKTQGAYPLGSIVHNNTQKEDHNALSDAHWWVDR
jgi:hypothetical protein